MKEWYKSFPYFLDVRWLYKICLLLPSHTFQALLSKMSFSIDLSLPSKVIFNNALRELSTLSFKTIPMTFCYQVFFSSFASVQTLYRQISCPCWCSRTHNAVWPVLSNCYKDKPWEPWATTAWESVLNFLWSVPDAACWTVAIESESRKVAR